MGIESHLRGPKISDEVYNIVFAHDEDPFGAKLNEAIKKVEELVHGFTTEQTQRWADLHLRATGELTREVAEFRQMGEKRYSEVEGWKTEFQNDLYFGGAKAEQTLSQARKVVNSLGLPEEVARIKTELNRTGLGNHPVLIKGLARLARFVNREE